MPPGHTFARQSPARNAESRLHVPNSAKHHALVTHVLLTGRDTLFCNGTGGSDAVDILPRPSLSASVHSRREFIVGHTFPTYPDSYQPVSTSIPRLSLVRKFCLQ